MCRQAKGCRLETSQPGNLRVSLRECVSVGVAAFSISLRVQWSLARRLAAEQIKKSNLKVLHQHLHLMPAVVDTMKKAQLIAELNRLGEYPPTRWTAMELRQRLVELQPELGQNQVKNKVVQEDDATTLAEWVTVINRKKQKKAQLVALCQDHMGLQLSGHETVPQLEKQAMAWAIENTEPTPFDYVGFGKHAAETYAQAAEDTSYCAWIVKTFEEEKGADGRLKRLAKWLIKNPPTKDRLGKTAGKGYAKDTKPTSSSNGPAEANILLELTKAVKQLQEEVSHMKDKDERPRKEAHKTDAMMSSSDETDGSFKMVSRSP